MKYLIPLAVLILTGCASSSIQQQPQKSLVKGFRSDVACKTESVVGSRLKKVNICRNINEPDYNAERLREKLK
ncbi:hypothetical protein ACJJIC_16545 [Microbulbifer sp. ANSA002]|uniref:hypothetical protein n=1 Tax=unclassified Microbulbifer TaxID=2619833 RepID=UPI00404186C5